MDEYIKSKGIDAEVIVQPKRSEGGMPDMLLKSQNGIIGHIEVKDIPNKLDETEKTNQLTSYRHAYPNLILSDLFSFYLYRNGKKISTATLANKNSLLLSRKVPKINDAANVEKLLDSFLAYVAPESFTAKELATELAKRAKQLSNAVVVELKDKNTLLLQVYESLKNQLLPSLTEEYFADMYAQTLAYGLFFAKVEAGSKQFNRINAYSYLPNNIPLLRRLFYIMQDPSLIDPIKWILDDIVTVLNKAKINSVLKNLHTKSWSEDPIIHFYETFLAVYNPKEREHLGVYYTPAPVVAYIMASVQEFLVRTFGKQDGLADSNVTLLDPASGTLTFPIMGIRLCFKLYSKQGKAGAFPSLVKEHILKNFFAFELLLAPYVIGHFKATLSLQDLGCDIADERFQLFLTNALEMKLPSSQHTLFPEIENEGRSASRVKEEPVFVIVGNPPYSVSSDNKSEFIENLMDAYKENLDDERNIQPLSDDYIKFIRFANWKIAETAGKGIVGMITNNAYLDGLIHRSLRKKLFEDFDQIYILNLHGNSRSHEKTPEGGKDENVFDIQQGVAILFLIKNGGEKKVYYADLWADRDSKYQWLLSHNAFNTKWIELRPAPREFWFYPKENSRNYDSFPLLSDMMPFHRQGVKTHRDWLVVGFDKEEITTRLNSLKTLPEDEILIALQIGEHYRAALAHAKKLVLALPDIDEHKIERYSYRPFDTRFIYYDNRILDRPRPDLYKQMGSIFLVTRRNSRQWPGLWSFAYVTNEIPDIDMRGGVYVFPLMVNGKPNFSKTFLTWVTEQFGQLFDSQSLLGYIYGILYCNSYRKKYGSELRTCFPRIPLTPDKELFMKICSIGKELIELHLLSSRKIWQSMAGFPEIGNDIVEKILYDPENFRVLINGKQYFSKVDPEIWNYEVGGYRVCERWLRERNGRKLNSDDQIVFMRMVGSIKETLKLQQELDVLFPQIELNVVSLIQTIEQQKL
ncbi:MAG: type ISP restriction/modification enzyme [Candidatus Bathyarchaeia archaeon]